MLGMVGSHHSGPVIRHSFENCPSGTEENGLICLEEGWSDTVRHELGASPTFGRISRTMPKSTILKPQVADSLLLKNKGMVRDPGANVVDGRDSWRGYSGCHGFTPRARHFKALLRKSVPDG